jgi:hypothetical protein
MQRLWVLALRTALWDGSPKRLSKQEREKP